MLDNTAQDFSPAPDKFGVLNHNIRCAKSCDGKMEFKNPYLTDIMDDVESAQAEHAALVAVAEAAEAIVIHRTLAASARMTTIGELHQDLETAVANLAAVREAKTIQVLTDEEYDKAISGRKRERREVVRVEKLQIKAAVRGESEGGK